MNNHHYGINKSLKCAEALHDFQLILSTLSLRKLFQDLIFPRYLRILSLTWEDPFKTAQAIIFSNITSSVNPN